MTYLYGASGVGKTWGIFEQHDPWEICRITNYRGARGISFDGYNGQDVLVFEEFNSQVPIEDMLNYLDIYPLHLPGRYNDRVALLYKGLSYFQFAAGKAVPGGTVGQAGDLAGVPPPYP